MKKGRTNIKPFDYCYLCGRKVDQDKWRLHMQIKHAAVLSEDPKPNGRWSYEYKVVPLPRGWQKMKGI